MATIWLSEATGNDGNDGSTYALAKATWKAAFDATVVAGAGSIMNVVGSVTVPSSATMTATNMTGTDFDTDPGMRIIGVDSSGDKSHATVMFQDNTTGQALGAFSTATSYIDIQGIIVDDSARTSSGTKTCWQMTSTTSLSLRIQDCVFIGGSLGGSSQRIVQLNWSGVSSSTSTFHFKYNITKNMNAGSTQILCDEDGIIECDHNIWLIYQTTLNNLSYRLFDMGGADGAATDHSFTYNTAIFGDPSGAPPTVASSANFAWLVSDDSAPSSSGAQKYIHSNICSWHAPQSTAKRFLEGAGSGIYTSWDGGTLLGYNLFIDPHAQSWASTGHPYELPWNPDAPTNTTGATWTGDQEPTTTAEVFNDDVTTYDWGMSGNGYTYTLPGDFRIKSAYRTAGSGSTVPGAIADAIETYIIGGSDVTLTADIGSSYIGEVAITNSGTGTLVISNIAFAAVSDSGGTLTYMSGSSDSISAGATAYYYVAFAPTTHPTTATGTLTFTSNDDQGNGTFVINITGKSVNLWLPGDGPSTPIGPKSPATISPPNAKREERGVRVGMTLEKNTVFQWDFTTAVGGWSDNVTKLKTGRVVLATNTGLTAVGGLSLSGANKLMVQPQGGKSLIQAGSTTCLILDGGCLLLANVSNLTTFKMSNPDTLHTVTVHVYMSSGTIVKNDPRGVKSTANELSNPD